MILADTHGRILDAFCFARSERQMIAFQILRETINSGPQRTKSHAVVTILIQWPRISFIIFLFSVGILELLSSWPVQLTISITASIKFKREHRTKSAKG